jgi:SAM-dependent methyltransferase
MMAKRAWLSWRWHHRADLSEVMRRALKAEVLPELDGFQNFWAAVEAQDAEEVLRTYLDQETRKLKPHRVLDYGCGKGKLARLLRQHVPEVAGFDPDPNLAARWQTSSGQSPGLTFTKTAPPLAGQFDVVVCSLVLCELPDGSDYDRVLANLRKAVCSDGHVFVAVCNPFFTMGGPTCLHTRRDLPNAACYCQNFRLEEWVDPPGVLRSETHRPLRRLQRDLLNVGLVCEQVWQTKSVDQERFEPASDFLVMRLRPRLESAPPVSLLIKTCAMEWETLEVQVHHLVRQLERPHCFVERVLIVDSRRDGFLRQYAEGDYAQLQLVIVRLQADGWIDRVVIAPEAPGEVRELYRRWFGQEHTNTHAANGAQLAAMLAGFEVCSSELIFHVDSDVMVFRKDGKDDYLGELLAVMDQYPLAVTVSLSIACREPQEFTAAGPSGPWRTESRAGLVHRTRLLAGCPLDNPLTPEGFLLPWHRTVDRSVQRGAARSYRGASPSTYYIHPPNEFKRSRDAWMLVLDAVERGRIPPLQMGMPELVGTLEQWLAPERNEPFIFQICGRNVPPGRMWSCLDSILRQTWRDWGAIIVDDASNEESSQFLELLCQPHAERITLVKAPQRRGQLANMVLAIRQLCGNPDSVILTVDLDDALLGAQVLERVAQAYRAGADLTVGSMLRTDKHRNYPVNFIQPRQNRGGNVWQHLRTFRKPLFDQLPDACLRLDGQYVEVAQDWAYMIPIVELAVRPIWIQEALYLHEPSGVGKGAGSAERDQVIGRLLAENVVLTSNPQGHE